MVQTTVLAKSSYVKLLEDLRKLIAEGKRRAAEAASRELVATYWELGKRITEEHLPEQAGYAQTVIEDLADDLGMDQSTLKRCIYFFGAYPGSAPRGQGHFPKLVSLQGAHCNLG